MTLLVQENCLVYNKKNIVMKAFTDVKQSKTLGGILPLDSADSTWKTVCIAGDALDIPENMQYVHSDMPFILFSGIGVPCWSLSALLEFFRKINDNVEIWNDHEDWFVSVLSCETTSRDLLDACVAMVQILYEKKIINFNNKED